MWNGYGYKNEHVLILYLEGMILAPAAPALKWFMTSTRGIFFRFLKCNTANYVRQTFGMVAVTILFVLTDCPCRPDIATMRATGGQNSIQPWPLLDFFPLNSLFRPCRLRFVGGNQIPYQLSLEGFARLQNPSFF